MKSISKRKAARKQQKHSRKIQRQNSKRKRNYCLGKRLTSEQKKKRIQQLVARKEFKEKRKQLNREKEETEKIKHIQNMLFSIFNLDILDQLARKTGFIKRSGGEITAFAFMYIVSFGFFGNGEIALIYLVGGLSTHFKIIVTPQALSKRINSVNSTKFLKAVFLKLLGIQLKLGLKNQSLEIFSMFKGIYLQDSSQIELNEELSEHFKGFGGTSSKSALKLDFIYDIVNFLVYGIKITSATTNDQSNAKGILKYIKPGALVIRDLGYFTIDCLRKIGINSYYLTRLSISSHVYLNKEDDTPLDVPECLKKLNAEGKESSNIKVYLGKSERLETRLVAEKVPANVIKQRTDRFKKDRKKNPSPDYIEWSGYSIFITNIPETMFSGKMIIELYKIRWQIELVFKNFKSNVEVNIIKGTNKSRIDNLIYGKLITIIVMFIIQNYAVNIAKDKEVSGDKLVKLLMSDNRLRQAIVQNDMSMLLIILENDIILVCKQKRKRKTTFDSIREALENEKSVKNRIVPLEPCLELNFMNNQLQNAV